jgi:formate dehydrogenase major subunit
VIEGSNMAEAHPVGFQWVVEARQRGAKVIHVDPRFSRTSALADLYVPLRAGSDIAFLGGIVNYILEHGREFRDYVVNYTNAPVILDDRFADTEDLDGLFSGYDPESREYDPATWTYKDMAVASGAGSREGKMGIAEHAGVLGGRLEHGHPPHTDPTLQHPRCVFQVLKRHFSRYTPEMVAEVSGVPPERLVQVAEALIENSGPERTSAFVYSVGWTQHTVGVQYIRAACIIQLLLGNIGRPGGGILALRGHATIQGSTDVPTLYNLLPGYLPMPKAAQQGLDDYLEEAKLPAGFWGYTDRYLISLLKTWWGDAATADNDFCFDYLPRLTGDHSSYPTMLGMLDGSVKGFFLPGQNPAVGSANGGLHRKAMANLEWLVVRDMTEIESASFWYGAPEIETGELATERIRTEVFLMPAASHVEKDGSFTNTQRLLQWHHKAVEPPGDCRSELWFYYHLGRIVRRKLAGSSDPKDRPILDLTWDYPTEGEIEEPSAEAVLREVNGVGPDGRAVDGYLDLKADGSTACGCWIYSGCYAGEQNQAARRKPHWEQSWVAPEWAWAWPYNRRILYNRASADPQGRPWSERKRYVWWDEQAGKWTGHDNPDFVATTPPDYDPPEGAEAEKALGGGSPFIMQADGLGWLYVPNGLADGPLPAHYEPHESPVANRLYRQQANPTRQVYDRPGNRYNPSDGEPGGDAYPYVLTTYRLTEHHTTGAMSRGLPYLAELQPELFCEVSPELAAERGLRHGGWATIVTARAAIEARVLVTRRIRALTVEGRTIHQVGLPWHWGYQGLVRGDVTNDLFGIVLDTNVHIQESKATSCDVRPGRRPRGPELPAMVEDYRRRATESGDGDGAPA